MTPREQLALVLKSQYSLILSCDDNQTGGISDEGRMTSIGDEKISESVE